MGTPVPDNSQSQRCSICWGSGKPFGSVPTPLQIVVEFRDIEHGPAWTPAAGEFIEGLIILPQEVGNPCSFQKIFDPFGVVDVTYFPGTTNVVGRNAEGKEFFLNQTFPPCQTFLDNTLNLFFTGGTVTITV